jgi:hypothetical protein
MRKIQNEEVQVEFNDPVENDTTNLDIKNSEEKVIKKRLEYKEIIKLC